MRILESAERDDMLTFIREKLRITDSPKSMKPMMTYKQSLILRIRTLLVSYLAGLKNQVMLKNLLIMMSLHLLGQAKCIRRLKSLPIL